MIRYWDLLVYINIFKCKAKDLIKKNDILCHLKGQIFVKKPLIKMKISTKSSV